MRLFLWFLLTPPFLVAASLGVQQWLRALLVSSRNTRSAVIVGTTKMALELARTLHQRPELGLKLRCVFTDEAAGDPPIDDATSAAIRNIAGAEIRKGGCVSEYINARHIDVVFIAREAHAPGVRGMCDELRDTTSSVYLIPDVSLYDLMQARVGDVDGIPVVALCESPLQGGRGALKRVTDIAFATLLLIVAAPVMLLIALAIKLDSPGRVFFKQDRYGLDGERIVVYKFRTMTVCENGLVVVQAKRNDARVTRVGRFLRRTSLDELPQLINVLQGRMSLVGPRPHAVAHNEEYRKLISGYMVRHKVTPGDHGPGSSQRLPRRDVDARRHAPARAVRPRVSPALVLAAGHQDHVAHARARVLRQACLLTREESAMKRHECARRFGACLIFGCACVGYAARGYADWEAIPDVRLEAETNDNPSLNMVGTTQLVDSASRLLADAALRIRNAEPRGEISFEPRVRTDAYAEEEAQALESTDVFLRSSGVHRGQTVRIGYSADIASERILGVEFLETLPTEPIGDDPTAIVTSQVGVNEKRTRLGVSPYVEIAMNSRSTLLLDGRIVDVDYESGMLLGRTDFLERAIGGEYRARSAISAARSAYACSPPATRRRSTPT